MIVTNDADFEELSVLIGPPPQIIWLKGTNVSKAEVFRLLTTHQAFIRRSVNDGLACIEITKGG